MGMEIQQKKSFNLLKKTFLSKTILLITDNFMPETNASATRAWAHARIWAAKGYKVKVLTTAPNFPFGKVYEGYSNKVFSKNFDCGVEIFRVWSFISENKGFFMRVLDFISFGITAFFVGLFIKSDKIIATSPQFFVALSAMAISFFKRTPWIMEVRDLWPDSIKSVGLLNDGIIFTFLKKLEMICYKSSSKIIVVTKTMVSELIKKGVSKNKIEVVYNGVKKDDYKKKYEKINLPNLEGKTILGYIGTHGMAHKLDFIIKCAANFQDKKNLHFLFVGDGSELNNLKNQSRKLNNVTFIGNIPKSKIPSYYSLIDFSIVNLKKDDLFKGALPSKIFESCLMLKPVLLGVDGEAKTLIDKYKFGVFYEPENIDAFKKAVEEILKKDYLDLQNSCKGVSNQFDRDILAIKMVNLIFES